MTRTRPGNSTAWMYWPAVLVVFVVIVIPTVQLFSSSFRDIELLYGRDAFDGIGNYIKVLSNPDFYSYLWNTIVYVIASVIGSITLGVLLAVCVNAIPKGQAAFLTLLLIPWMIPDVAAGVMWRWVLDKEFGILNWLLIWFGVLETPVYWLGRMPEAMISVVAIEVWTKVPVVVLLVFAGLQRVPQELVEAMVLDGASAWTRFTKLTLPYIAPELLFATSIITLFTIRAFGLIYVVTGGGPGDSTEVLATYIYKTGQLFLRQGYSSAVSMILLVITVAILFVYIRTIRGRVYA